MVSILFLWAMRRVPAEGRRRDSGWGVLRISSHRISDSKTKLLNSPIETTNVRPVMRLRCSLKPLPRVFANHPKVRGLKGEHDIRMRRGSRLFAKLLIFDSRKSLRYFWAECLGCGELGRYCCGAVNSLIQEVEFVKKGCRPVGKRHLEADARYFCVIGLIEGHLGAEVISHEAVHAGFSYAKRIRRSPWDIEAKHFDEEAVCYPAGRVSAEIARFLWAKGFLKV